MNRRFAGDDLIRDIDGVIHRNGKTHARARTRVRLNHGIDADELALVVHESATGVTGVDGGVGLDHVRVNGGAARTLKCGGTVQSGDDTRRDGLLVAKGATDCHNPLTHGEIIGVGEVNGREIGVLGVLEADHGEVARLIRAHDLGLIAVAAVRAHHQRGSTLNYVVVRENVAIGVEDDAATDAAGVLGLALSGDRHHRWQSLGGNGLRKRGVLGIDLDGLRGTTDSRLHIGARNAECAGHHERDHEHGSYGKTEQGCKEDRKLAALGLHHGTRFGMHRGHDGGLHRWLGVRSEMRLIPRKAVRALRGLVVNHGGSFQRFQSQPLYPKYEVQPPESRGL